MNTISNFYYVAEVREPMTCRVVGYIVKEAKTKTKVDGCPLYKERERAERYLEGMLSVC